MLIYIVSLIFIVLLNFIKLKEETKKKLCFLIFILLTVISSIRKYTVGADTAQFWDNYRYIGMHDISKILELRFEIGYIVVCYVLNLITKNPQILLVVTSVFTNIIIYRFILKNAKNILFSTLLYVTLNYYFAWICLMRQGIAIAFILIGYEYLKNKKYVSATIFIIIASLFHKSALIMLVLIPVRMFNKCNFIVMLTIVSSIVGFIVAPILLKIASYFGDYEKYLTSVYNASSYVSAGLYTLTNFLFLIFGIYIPKRNKINKELEKNDMHKLLINSIGIATIVSAISMRVSIFNRIFYYFAFFNVIFVANSYELIEDRFNRMFWKIVIIVASICYVVIITYMGWFGVYPYVTFWQ